MKAEFTFHTFGDGTWWFDLGVSCQKTEYHHKYNMVFTIALGVCSIYIRW